MAENKEIVRRDYEKKQPIWRVTRAILRPFIKKKVTFLGEGFVNKCIIVSNHDNKSGPLTYDVSLPVNHARWGAGEMLGNYKSRYHYLRDVLYIQKNGKNPVLATIKSIFEAIFSPAIYKGMRVLPTYTDARILATINDSVKILDKDMAIAVYPEDSSKGYFDVMTKFFSGFVLLAQKYYKKTGEDLPVYPVYCSRKNKHIIVGKPVYVQELIKQGLDREAIAQYLCDRVNDIYFEYFQDKK